MMFIDDEPKKPKLPENQLELANYLEKLWNDIFERNAIDKINLYNEGAQKYNKAASAYIMELITNFQKQKQKQKQMATKSNAVVAAAPATKESKAQKQAKLAAKNTDAAVVETEPKAESATAEKKRLKAEALANVGATADALVAAQTALEAEPSKAKKVKLQAAVDAAAEAHAAAKIAAGIKEKKVSQKEQVIELAGQGMTVDQVVEATGIKKTNVAWYFSKHGLNKAKKVAAAVAAPADEKNKA